MKNEKESRKLMEIDGLNKEQIEDIVEAATSGKNIVTVEEYQLMKKSGFRLKELRDSIKELLEMGMIERRKNNERK